MHPVQSDHSFSTEPVLQTARPHPANLREAGPFRRWMANAMRKWQRRRMIAIFNAMDDRLLSDVGIARADISRVVAEFNERELRMSPTVQPRNEVTIYDEVFRKAA